MPSEPRAIPVPPAHRAPPVKVVSAEFEAGATRLDGLPLLTAGVAEVAFAGRSNVGKSSLMNTLVQRTGLVRTSSTPGCTRALNLFSVGLEDGSAYRFVDLPGYGYAKLSRAEKAKWGAMIEGYLRGRASLVAVVLLVDIRRGIEPDDRQLAEYVRTCRVGAPTPALACVVVATKLDKLPLSKRKPALARFQKETGVTPIGFSAVTGDGRDALWGWIRRAAQP